MLERCERGGCGGEITPPFQFSAVTCSRIRICRVGLYNVGVFGFALLQAEFLASVPFISNAGLAPGSPRVSSVPFVARALALCPRSPLPSGHRPFCSQGRADCSPQEKPCQPLPPSLLSPQVLPWVSCSSSSFCPTFFSLPVGVCPSLPSHPQLFLQSCPI